MFRFTLAGLFAVFFGTASQATIIDFESGVPVTDLGGSFTIGDYRFSVAAVSGATGGFLFGGDLANGPADDNNSLFNANGAEFTLTRVDGMAFDLFGFDIARRPFDLSGDRPAPSVTLIGSLAAGGTVEFNTGALTDGFVSKSPGGFASVTSVLFRPSQSSVTPDSSDYEFLVDNLNVEKSVPAVPLPAGGWLLASGLVAFGLARQRRIARGAHRSI